MILKLSKNLSALTLIQIINLLIPLITLPYLARVLGVIAFGKLSLCLAIIQYIIIFIEYGFHLSVTAKVAENRNNIKQLNKIFFTTLFAKIALGFIATLVSAYAIIYIKQLNDMAFLILCSYGSVIAAVIQPLWLFQGLERMDIVAKNNVIFRLLSVPLIFFFINEPNDIYRFALIQSAIAVVSVIFLLVEVKINNLISKFYLPTLNEIYCHVLEGRHLFVSIAAVSLYTNTNIVMLGLFSNNIAIGYFAATDKIKNAFLSITTPFTQAIYPKVNFLMATDRNSAVTYLVRHFVIYCAVATIYSFLIYIFAPILVRALLGEEYLTIVNNLRVLAILPLLVILTNFYGTQIMLPLGLKKQFMYLVVIAGFLNISILIPLISRYEDLGACFAIVLIEFFLTLTLGYIVHRNFKEFHVNVLEVLWRRKLK